MNDDADSVDSGRSTPEHLKKYSGSADVDGDGEEGDEDEEEAEKDKAKKRSRTFSETLKMLDDDILAELDVN